MTIAQLNEALKSAQVALKDTAMTHKVFSSGVPGIGVQIDAEITLADGRVVPCRGFAALSIPGASKLPDPDGFVQANRTKEKASGKLPGWARDDA